MNTACNCSGGFLLLNKDPLRRGRQRVDRLNTSRRRRRRWGVRICWGRRSNNIMLTRVECLNIFWRRDVAVETRSEAASCGVLVDKGNKGWYALRPRWGGTVTPRSRLMHLVKHQLSRDTSLWAVELTGSPLERGDVLLYDLVEEHGG